MYIKDGSNDDYSFGRQEESTYSWGWLGNHVESSGWNSEDLKKQVIEKLSDLGYEKTIYHTRGIHICEMCGNGMGNSVIKISYNGKFYTAPSDVVHYIKEHDYCPDDIVIEAVLNGYYLNDDDIEVDWTSGKLGEEEVERQFKSKLEKALMRGMRGLIK